MRIGDTAATPSTFLRSSTTPSGIGSKPFWLVTMPAARTWLFRPSSIVALMPAAKIATNTTSATPIISADAVVAVRCGWRWAFSRARRPVSPWMRSSGFPITRLIGRTSDAATSAKPNIIRTAPRPSDGRGRVVGRDVAEQRVEHHEQAGQREQHRGDDPAAAQPRGARGRGVAQRGDRLDARGATCRDPPGHGRGDHADGEADDDRARLDREAGAPRGRARSRRTRRSSPLATR